LNAGYNYILASSHYVNTPFRPRYVKKEELFSDMEMSEKREVLQHYRDKEVLKIKSLSEKLSEHEVPEVSGELMDSSEREDVKEFIYGHKTDLEDEEKKVDVFDPVDLSLDTERPGVFVVGAHPTLIERNEKLMDVFRSDDGIATTSEIQDELESFIYDTHIDGVDVDLSEAQSEWLKTGEIEDMMTDEDFKNIYPVEALRSYYEPMIRASEDADNFMFEVNGKGVERQTPSVFWYMLDENAFGSDAHRPDEQPQRSEIFSEKDLPGELKFLSEKWLQQMDGEKPEKDIERQKKEIKA